MANLFNCHPMWSADRRQTADEFLAADEERAKARRAFLEVARPRTVAERHPRPWHVRQVRGPRWRDSVYDYVVQDAHGHYVCETQDPVVAEAIVAAAAVIQEHPSR